MMSFWGSASQSPANEDPAPSIALLQTATQTLHKENFDLREKLGAAQAVIDGFKEDTLLEAQVDSVLLLEADRKYEKLRLEFVDMKQQRDHWQVTCKESTERERELCEVQIQAITKKMEQNTARLEANKAQLVHSLLTAETAAEKAKEQLQMEKDVNIQQAAELSKAQNTIKELEAESARSANDTKEKLCRLQQENHDMSDSYHKAEEEKMELTNTVQYLKAECARLQTLYEESIVAVQQSMQETVTACEEAQRDKSQLQSRIKELQVAYINIENVWEAKLAEHEEKASQALIACQKNGDERVQAKVDEIQGKMTDLEESKAQLLETLLSAESLADQAVKHLEAERETNQRLKDDLGATGAKLLELEEEYARFQELVLEQNAAQEEEKEKALSANRQEASNAIEELTRKLEATEEELEEAKSELQEALQKILTVEEQSVHKMKIEKETNARLSAEISEAYIKIQNMVEDNAKIKSDAEDAIAATKQDCEDKAQAAVGRIYLKVSELEEANSKLLKQLQEAKGVVPQETEQAQNSASTRALEALKKTQARKAFPA